MTTQPSPPGSQQMVNVGFWLLLGLQALVVPGLALVAFFGAMAWERLSWEDSLQLVLMAIYPAWLIVVAFWGQSLLRRRRWLGALALALSPLLLLGSWLSVLGGV